MSDNPKYKVVYQTHIGDDPNYPDPSDQFRCLDMLGQEHRESGPYPDTEHWVHSEVMFDRMKQILQFNVPDNLSVLLQAELTSSANKTSEGVLIKAVAIPWFEIISQVERDPDFLYQFTNYPRKFEEFIAGTYERAGWSEVLLTPMSGDRGRDIIATKAGIGSIRIFDQVKAYSPKYFVTAEHVRALLGVLTRDQNVSKGIITTTSLIAPNVSAEFRKFIPYRIDLIDGKRLLEFLALMTQKNKQMDASPWNPYAGQKELRGFYLS